MTCVLVVARPTTAIAFSGFVSLPDFPVPNGHFYSQASGQGLGAGFTIVDDSGVMLYDEFTRRGAVDQLGYPASQRFNLGGFVTQATQKELLQWRPETNSVDYVNVFDLFAQRGLDPVLAQTRLIPPTADNSTDTRLPWTQVVSRHLALLDQNPAIKSRYFSDANPIADFGLPQGVADFGGVYVVRCERAAFQQWRVATPFANPGDVTQVNAGDLAKEFGIIPATAVSPVTASSLLVAPPGALIAPNPAIQAAARQSASMASSSLVRIDVTLPNGVGIASGVVLDQHGNILTNEHVVDQALTIKVTVAGGASAVARIIGTDLPDDLAVIQVPSGMISGGVTPASIVGSNHLAPSAYVVALGYSPYFPSPPAIRLGLFQRVIDTGLTVLRSDTFILPGDSGGMLLDLSGNVVGINDEIRFTQQTQQPLIGFSIDARDAARVAQRLIASGSTQ
jgi:hypothetical protein